MPHVCNGYLTYLSQLQFKLNPIYVLNMPTRIWNKKLLVKMHLHNVKTLIIAQIVKKISIPISLNFFLLIIIIRII